MGNDRGGLQSGGSQAQKSVLESKRTPASVTFLGTSSGGGPIPSRNCSSLLLNLEKSSWLFDCAEGTQSQIQRSQWKTSRIERIFITHMHADHTMGLAPLLGTLISGIQTSPESRSAMKSLGRQKRAKIHIYGPPGLRLMLRQILNLTALTLGDTYAVHELIPNQATLANGVLSSTSPTEGGNGPSCSCEAEELQAAEAVGCNLVADEDGCWRDIINRAELVHPAFDAMSQGKKTLQDSAVDHSIWRVDAGPVRHRVLSLGYIVSESPLMEALDLDAIMPNIDRQMERITQSNPRLRHPRQITSILTKTQTPYTLPDGQILAPPAVSGIQPRKIVILGDSAGTDNDAFLRLVNSPSLLIHECTNAWVDPRVSNRPLPQGSLEKAASQQASEVNYEAQQKIQTKAKSRGHSDAQMAGSFARDVSALRLAVNHFSAMFPSPKFAEENPFPSLTMPAYPLPSGRPAPPIAPGEIAKRITMANIESQITDAWIGTEDLGSAGDFRRAVTARDLMTYEVPAHDITQAEKEVMEQASREAKRLEAVWFQAGAEGFAKQTGCKLVGIWPERSIGTQNSGRGNVSANRHGRSSSSGNAGSGEDGPCTERETADNEAHATPSGSSSQPGLREVAGNVEEALIRTHRSNAETAKTKVEGKQALPQNTKGSSFRRHPTRHVALLFVYQGWHYSGLAIQQMPTPLPTVEGELLKALEKTHLIEAGLGWEGCEFSRCGRTDRGVSSAGQVVSLRIKSKRQPGDGGQPLHIDGDWQPARDIPLDPATLVDTSTGSAGVGSSTSTTSSQERIAMRIAGEYIAPEMSPEAIAKLPLRQQLKAMKKKNKPQSGPIAQGASEYSYPHILNRVLPPEIRVLAWSPLPHNPPETDKELDTPFDARFSCVTRHYRYFFSRRPIPDHPPLDVSLMQAAATMLEGEHDFRNFCKVDGSKQIENHRRRVLKAIIRPDDDREISAFDSHTARQDGAGDAFVFELIGSAFLWHQVRHIMSVLFHVGHGWEAPDIVSRLLHTGYIPPSEASPVSINDGASAAMTESTGSQPAVASKPLYVMGAALPLQLYRCGYDAGAVDWRYGGYDGPVQTASQGSTARDQATEGHLTVLNALKSQAEEARIKARQIEAFYQEAISIHRPEGLDGESQSIADTAATSYTLGGGEMQAGRKYVPFLDRPRGDLVEEQNRRWREGKGENRRLRKLAESTPAL